MTDLLSDEAIEAVAARLGAQHHPSYRTWQPHKTPRPVGVSRLEHGEWVWNAPGGADASTLVCFTAEDGYTSMRALTWREVVSVVAPLIEAAVRAKISAEILALRPDIDYDQSDYALAMRVVCSSAYERAARVACGTQEDQR